jgi:tryptophan-rich sensory protein
MFSYEPNSVIAWSAFIFFGSYIQLSTFQTRKWYEDAKQRSRCLPKNNGIFGLWTLWYLLIFFAAITYFHNHSGTAGDNQEQYSVALLWLLWGNILFNHLWTPIFFQRGMIAVALVILVLVWLTSISILVLFGITQEWISFGLFAPYPIWLTVALIWNIEVVSLVGPVVKDEAAIEEEMDEVITVSEPKRKGLRGFNRRL